MFVELTIQGINSRFSQLMSEKVNDGVIFRLKKGVYLANEPFYIDYIEKSAVKYGISHKLKIIKREIPDHIAIDMINKKKIKFQTENEEGIEIIPEDSTDDIDDFDDLKPEDLYVEKSNIDLSILKKVIKVFIEKEITIDFKEEEITRIVDLSKNLKLDENEVETDA